MLRFSVNSNVVLFILSNRKLSWEIYSVEKKLNCSKTDNRSVEHLCESLFFLLSILGRGMILPKENMTFSDDLEASTDVQVIYDRGVPVKGFNEIRSSLVSALASHGQMSDALDIYEEMKEAQCKLEPKAVVCLIVSAFLHMCSFPGSFPWHLQYFDTFTLLNHNLAGKPSSWRRFA